MNFTSSASVSSDLKALYKSVIIIIITHSSRKSWALIRWLGAAQQPPKSTHQSVSTNAVAAHLIQVAKAPHDTKCERQVRMQGRTLLQQMSDKSLHHPFMEEEISAALQKTKPPTAPGYDNIHVEFLKNLGPTAHTWLSKFFSRIMATHSIPKIWRKANVIAVKKPGKDQSLAANYHPISGGSKGNPGCRGHSGRLLAPRSPPPSDNCVIT